MPLSPASRPLLLRGATLLPGGTEWTPRPGLDLLVAAGRVAAIGVALPAPDGAEILEAGHLLLLPAFANTHTHSPEALARGRAPMARLDEWLAAEYAGGQDALPEAAIRRAIRIAAAECIRGGAVRATDHFRQVPPSAEAVAWAAAAWGGTGMKARVAMMVRDLPSPSAPDVPATAEVLEVARTVLRDPPPGAAVGLGPSAPQRCSDALLSGVARLVAEHGGFLHLHVCETALDAERCRTRFGVPAVAALEALGLAGPGVEYAHCVHLSDAELDRMAASGTLMVHNPLANMRLGSGIAPVARALARGVRVAIGSDGAGSADTHDLLEAAKYALMLPRVGRPDAEWPTPAQVLGMATGGAALAPGAAADAIAFDLRAPAFADARPDELAARLLLAARPRDLVHVLCDGAFLLRERELVPAELRAVSP